MSGGRPARAQPTAQPALSAMERVRNSRAARVSASLLVVSLALSAVAMLLVPWQQTSQGVGRVLAYAAVEREQLLEAPINGRIINWWVQEGSRVRKGERLLELADNDPQILQRLGQERDAGRAQLAAKRIAIDAYARQVEALRAARTLEIAAAKARVRMAQYRVKADQQAVAAAIAGRKAAEQNIARQGKLEKQGLVSRRDLELAEMGRAKAEADAFAAQAELEAERGDVLARRADVAGTGADFDAKIAKVQALKQNAEAALEKAKAELAKVEVRIARQAQMVVKAPRDGTVMRVIGREGGEFVKVGDPLLMFIPASGKRAVELWVDGNDAPLIHPGRHVRLQFEGWPAVQFTGWPSVAVGTFGGEVAFVDASAERTGQFRVVVLADAKGWPSQRYLRQGARVNGWVLLNRVSLGYEIWRQLNGFPPTVNDPSLKASVSGDGGQSPPPADNKP